MQLNHLTRDDRDHINSFKNSLCCALKNAALPQKTLHLHNDSWIIDSNAYLPEKFLLRIQGSIWYPNKRISFNAPSGYLYCDLVLSSSSFRDLQQHQNAFIFRLNWWCGLQIAIQDLTILPRIWYQQYLVVLTTTNLPYLL